MIVRSSLAALVFLVSAHAPVQAQYRQRTVEVFGQDKCPEARGGEIIVCKRVGESERFRIPTELRAPAVADSVSQEARVDEMVSLGRSGPGSCSPQGPGGFTGCFQKQVEANRAERRDVRRTSQEVPR